MLNYGSSSARLVNDWVLNELLSNWDLNSSRVVWLIYSSNNILIPPGSGCYTLETRLISASQLSLLHDHWLGPRGLKIKTKAHNFINLYKKTKLSWPFKYSQKPNWPLWRACWLVIEPFRRLCSEYKTSLVGLTMANCSLFLVVILIFWQLEFCGRGKLEPPNPQRLLQ